MPEMIRSNGMSKGILHRISKRFDEQDQKIADLQKLTQAKSNNKKITNRDLFNAMNSRFNKQDQKFTDINHTIMNMNKRFDDVNKRFTSVDERFNRMLYAQMGTIITVIVACFTILAKLSTF